MPVVRQRYACVVPVLVRNIHRLLFFEVRPPLGFLSHIKPGDHKPNVCSMTCALSIHSLEQPHGYVDGMAPKGRP